MALHAMWVHGTSVRAEWVGDTLNNVLGDLWDGSSGDVRWSNVNGLPRGWGTTFRGKRAFTGGLGGSTVGPFHAETPFQYSQKGYWFHFAIPTPVIVADRRAQLRRVFVLWGTTAGVSPVAVHVFDGANRILTTGVTGSGPAMHPRDLTPGVTQFDLSTPHSVIFSIGVSVAVSFAADGDVTFFSAGADFDI
jgi:hypothetical protein